jgi:hypothetical protein
VGAGSIVAAVMGGILLGGAALVAFLLLHPADAPAKNGVAAAPPVTMGDTPKPPASTSAIAPAPVARSAGPPAMTAPTASAVDVGPTATATASVSATARAAGRVPAGTGHKAPAAPPADTGKKSIFVRD